MRRPSPAPPAILPAIIAAAAFLPALGACQQARDDSNIAIDNGANSAAADVVSLPPSEQGGAPVELNTGSSVAHADRNAATPSPAPAPAAAAVIPATYRGRWGIVAADCTSTRGDAKGMITIGDRTIRFYESTATLEAERPALSTSFSGSYGFEGEGQSWHKIVTLTRTGDRLQRADDEGRTTYQRCA